MAQSSKMHTGHRARLKEEFLARGLEGWSDHKVLELLLYYAIPQGDVNPVAHRLIDAFGDLAGVLDASSEALKQVLGVGEHTALLLKLIPQICGRYLAQTGGVLEHESADRASDYARQFYPYFTGAVREKICMLSLDSRCKVLGIDMLGEGDLAEVELNHRRIMEAALAHNARGVVLAHNHVGAYANPSMQDLTATEEIRVLLDKVGITLVDHLIFNGEDYISMMESGYLRR